MKAKLVNEANVFQPKSSEEAQNILKNILTHIEDGDIDIGQLQVANVDHDNDIITLSQSWSKQVQETSVDYFEYNINKRSEFDFDIELIINIPEKTIKGTGSVTNDDMRGWSYDYTDTDTLNFDITDNFSLEIEECANELAGSIEYGNPFTSSAEEYLSEHKDNYDDNYDEDLDEYMNF